MATTKTALKANRSGAAKRQERKPSHPTDQPLSASRFAWLDNLSASRIILLVCLLSSLAYANSLGGDFVFDDIEQVVENADIRSWDNLTRAFTADVWAFRERSDILRAPVAPPYYRPIFTLLITVEYQVFGLWQQGWHLVSLLLHMLCAAGVYYVLAMISRRTSVAAIAALIFAVFPAHAESVSWISGVTDPLFGAFFLFSFYHYLKFRESKKPRSLVLSLALFALAAYSKETALSLVVLVFAYEFIEAVFSRSKEAEPKGLLGAMIASGVSAARSSVPFVLVAIVYLIPRYLVLGGLTWKMEQAYDGPLIHTLFTLPYVVGTYLLHLLWPVGLSVAYHTSFVKSAASMKFILPALALALSASVLIYNRKRVSREAWHALALIFVPLLPVLNLTQLSERYLIFDRYLYLSVAGYGLLIALALVKLSELQEGRATASAQAARKPFAYSSAMLGLMLVAMTAATARENLNWADSYSLWSNAARVSPLFSDAHYNTGLSLIDLKRYAEARAALERAAELDPGEPETFDALGRACEAMGDSSGAVKNFNRAIELDPAAFESINNLGTVYFKLNDYAAAERQFAAALRLKPQATAARFNLALCYARQNRYAESAREFEQVIQASPSDAETYYELGRAYEKSGRVTDAVRAYERGLELARSGELADKLNESLRRARTE